MRRTGGLLETGKILYLPAAQIRPNPGQPRKIFDPAGLQELAASIAEYGIVQPLTVRRRDGFYELVAGERRLRAARMAGLREVPCILLSVDEAQSGMVALVENLQRRDLDYIEEAEGLARLMRLYGLSQEQAAQRVGKSQSAVANKLRLLRHSPQVLAMLRENQLSERHARALLRLPEEEDRLAVLQTVIRQQLNVAKTEAYIDAYLAKKNAQEPPKRGIRKLIVRDVRLFLNSVNHSLELIRSGVPNIVCIQPFACLPNHVVGKGVIKSLRRAYPEANIVAVDYDPGASEVNQLNRIKLMLSTARKNLNARPADPQPAAVV